MITQVNLSEAGRFLREILEENANSQELEWIKRQETRFQEGFELRSFYLTFSTASRFIRKTGLALPERVLAQADALRSGFQPLSWSLLQCARTYFLLLVPPEDLEVYQARLTKLYETADVEEQITLYGALPLLPYPSVWAKRATEGLRTNMTAVFDAIALDNPYPADYLTEPAWNQMVLKAVFMERPLYRIYGADERANPELAEMLIDFAHERWAADRKVLPELWRFVGPFLNLPRLGEIENAIKGSSLEREAGLLACAQSKLPEARKLLLQNPGIQADIEEGRITWNSIGRKYHNSVP